MAAFFKVTIPVLTCRTADNRHSNIISGFRFPDRLFIKRHLREIKRPVPPKAVIYRVLLVPVFVCAFKYFVNFKPVAVFDSVGKADSIRLVYISARAVSDIMTFISRYTEKRNLCALFQRKNSIVFNQNSSLCRRGRKAITARQRAASLGCCVKIESIIT